MKRPQGSGQADNVRPGRRSIAVSTVKAAVAQMERDGSDRPQPVTTLMGMVRLMAPIILAHKSSGWSDPQIVALLKDRGFEISVGTLTVYRHRLVEELEGADAGTCPAEAIPPSVSQANTIVPEPPPGLSALPVPRASEPSRSGPADGVKEPPRFNPEVDFDDIV